MNDITASELLQPTCEQLIHATGGTALQYTAKFRGSEALPPSHGNAPQAQAGLQNLMASNTLSTMG